MDVLEEFKELLPPEHCGSLLATTSDKRWTAVMFKGEYIKQKGGMTAALHNGNMRKRLYSVLSISHASLHLCAFTVMLDQTKTASAIKLCAKIYCISSKYMYYLLLKCSVVLRLIKFTSVVLWIWSFVSLFHSLLITVFMDTFFVYELIS